MSGKGNVKKRILIITVFILVLICVGIVILYLNLNRLLTNALNNGFNSNVISNVYELKFENLEVNIPAGSVKVLNVTMYPREKPVHDYPYINSSFQLEARKMNLKNVDLIKLIRFNKLDLEQIELVEPGIDFNITDSVPVFFPFSEKDTVSVKTEGTKKSIGSYFLEEFSMVDAHFRVSNSAKFRQFNIQRINISLKHILIDRHPGRDLISYNHFDFSVGEMTGNLQRKGRDIQFKDFKVNIDSLQVEQTLDTVIYHFADINTSIKNLDIETADSLYHFALESFNLSYKENSIEFNNLSFKPNISDAAMQKRNPYRKEHFAASIKSIKVLGLNFDSLAYARKLFIQEILLNGVSASIFKDLTKPFPPNHHPEYLGQQIQAISMPLTIQHIKATDVKLINTEVLPDGSIGKANLNRVTLEVDNLTSLPNTDLLTIKAEAYIENKAHAHLQMQFDYNKPQFSIDGQVDKFDLTDLNDLTNSYAPARIKKGIVDGITFSGMVYKTRSTGTMKFLYHDLVVDVELEDKAKWKSAVLGFAANTYLNAANPVSENHPVREVRFEVVRDMRKGYLSMLIKSILDGLKETFIMSKENKQKYREAKAESKAQKKGKK